MKRITVRKFRKSDLESIKQITKSLHPDWFTKKALENIPRDIQLETCFVAEKNGKVVGFISVHSYEGKPMLGWMGIDKKLRRAGTGKLLLGRVETELKNLGYKGLRVETVGECSPAYKPYAETVKFYKSVGFKIKKRGRLRFAKGYKHRLSTFRKELK